MSGPFDGLTDQPARFWICPVHRGGRVRWDGDQAACMEEGCGRGATVMRLDPSEIRDITPEEAAPSYALDDPIEKLELSVRTYNLLKREGITTVGQMVDLWAEKGPEGLSDIRNFGQRSVDEVAGWVSRLAGFVELETMPEDVQARVEAMAPKRFTVMVDVYADDYLSAVTAATKVFQGKSNDSIISIRQYAESPWGPGTWSLNPAGHPRLFEIPSL